MIQVDNVAFGERGITLTYVDMGTDVRMDGAVFIQHQLNIAAGHPGYRQEIEEIRDRIIEFVTDVLDDYKDSPAWTPEDAEELPGMGVTPEELGRE